MTDLINNFCSTNNPDFLLRLDNSSKQFIIDCAKYCIKNKKGDIPKANMIMKVIGDKHTTKYAGIVINRQLIKSISGPVYLSILKPKMDYFKKLYSKEKTFAPVFMLFGDVHQSNEEMCTDCTCNIHNSGCCYKIYEDKFLKLLDQIPEPPKFNVDFSMESSITDRSTVKDDLDEYVKDYQEGEKNAYVLKLLRERIYGCYSKKMKINEPLSYKKYCPTQNIRWHSVDTRLTWQRKSTENSTWEYFIGNELSELFKFFQPTLVVEITWCNDFKEKLEEMLYFFISKDKRVSGSSYECGFINCILDKNKINYLRKSIDLFTDDNYYNKFIANKKNSLICKQISKMKNISIQNQWYAWIKKYFSYKKDVTEVKVDKIITESWNKFINLLISYSEISGPDKESRTQAQIKYINDIYKTKKEITGFDFMPFYTESNSLTYYDINKLLSMNTTLLDLYYLTRMFKKPTNDYNPLLSIGYFGMQHSQDINHFLLNITGLYENVYTESNIVDDKQFRCLDIKEHINLDEILDTYKKVT